MRLRDPLTESLVYRDQYLPKHPYLVPALRNLFATSVSSCFSKVNLTHLQKWLDLPENEVGKWCEAVGWKVDGSVAVVPKNGDNDVKAGVVKENVELSREYSATRIGPEWCPERLLTLCRIDQAGCLCRCLLVVSEYAVISLKPLRP